MAGIDTFAGHSSLKTWLVRIVANQAIKVGRSNRAWQAAAARTRASRARAATGDSAGRSIRAARASQAAVDCRLDLAEMLRQLSATSRQVLLLREVNCLSYQEIAEALRVPQGTVESRLFRARRQMKRKFDSYLE